ncbi:MAG: RpiB/LacA/LacB family sugar-phosphate isomerase [Candidatus Latescibacter sp.]|nr:RpiB/LacA/LacB family sugar-phosphate isomerase [Candidatus Latescibacter sp.]
MNQDELIEAVVKEVKRVLALKGVQVASAPEKPPVSGKAVSPHAKPALEAPRTDSGGGDLTGKQVIIQKDLLMIQGKTVRIARKAVVTPLALDYAREKGITIMRVDATEKKEGMPSLPGAVTVGLAVSQGFPGNSGILCSILAAKGFQVRELSGASYETAVKNMCNAVASGTAQFGICLEKTGLEGPIHANRNQVIRAVHCRGIHEARAARVDIGANVIVLDAESDPEEIVSGFTGL